MLIIERATEIERENRILFEKMYHIMHKSSRMDNEGGRNQHSMATAANQKIYNTIAVEPGITKPRGSSNRYLSPLIIETKASNSPRGEKSPGQDPKKTHKVQTYI